MTKNDEGRGDDPSFPHDHLAILGVTRTRAYTPLPRKDDEGRVDDEPGDWPPPVGSVCIGVARRDEEWIVDEEIPRFSECPSYVEQHIIAEEES